MGNGVKALDHAVAARLGARAAWFISKDDFASVLNALKAHDAPDHPVCFIEPLAAPELRVPDLRALGEAARVRGKELLASGADLQSDPALHNELVVVDITRTTLAGCAACRLGAHVAYARVAEANDAVALGLSRDARRTAPWLLELLNSLERPQPEVCELLSESLASLDAVCRTRNDAAMAVASYLACHPRVEQVWYPGLPDHPDHIVASQQLTGGFGAWVCYQADGAVYELHCTEDPFETCTRLEAELACDCRSDVPSAGV